MCDTVPDSPFFGVFLEDQEDINQILPRDRIKETYKVRDIADGIELQMILFILQNGIQGSEHVLF